jgi:endonuclease YncB( thermonuclease family)
MTPGTRHILALAGAVLAAALAPVATAAAEAGRNAGPARVIDALTLRVGGVVFRLFGIDAPDPDQVCERRGRSLPCGDIARTALMDLVAGAVVICTPVRGQKGGADRIGRVIARCESGGFDIGTNMVHTGWALADPDTGTARLRRTQAKARKRQAGLWRLSFAPPWVWRARAAGAESGEVCLSLRVTDEGVECPALRGADGALYTIAGKAALPGPGEEVCVCGRFVDISTCQQGKTLVPRRIGPAASCAYTNGHKE